MILTRKLLADAIEKDYNLNLDEHIFSDDFRKPIRNRECMTREELLEVVRWKAVRATGHISADDRIVREVTEAAFTQQSAKLANWMLTYLNGVGVPMASAILTVFDEKAYTVIDVRAMNTLKIVDLETMGLEKPEWLANDLDWRRSWIYEEYVVLCKALASELGIPLRDLDRGLWALNGRDSIGAA